MKISFSTLACPSWTISQVIQHAVDLGFNGIELRFIENEDRLWERPEFSGTGLRETRNRLNDSGLTIPCVDTSCFFHFTDRNLRQQSIENGRAMVELAAELMAPGIRVFGDRVQPGADLHSTTAWIADGIQSLAQFARPLGVQVWLESHGDFACASETLKVLELVDPPNKGVLWDPLNAYSEFDEHPQTGWSTLDGAIRHVHIKDAQRVIGAPRSQPWEPVLVGEGDFPALELVTLLHLHDYQGFVSFEWEKRWHPQIPNPEIALPRFMHWIHAALESLHAGHKKSHGNL